MSQVKLGDVAVESRETYKGDKTGIPIVGLEHITPGEVTLSNWDTDTDNTFTKRFRKGDMLFGRRRAYLKKAAQAPFDGLCSGDITVIRAKEDLLLPELLPFIIQNDDLFDFAVGKSAGSLSPRVKWDNLKNYTFELPSMGEQKKLAEVLWSINDTLQSYQKLLSETDALVQAQFVEMFDINNHSFPESKIIDVCANKDDIKCGPFGTQLKQSEYETSGVAVWGIPEINSDFKKSPDIFVTQEKAQNLSAFSLIPGDIAMSRKGNVGRCAIFPDTFAPGIIASDVLRIRIDANHLLPKFMQYQLHHSEKVKRQIELVSNGVVMAGINVTKLKNILLYIPPMDSQKEFVQLVDKAEKSKSTLTGAITSLKATKRSILENALGSRRKE